jgi:hypothetical protein
MAGAATMEAYRGRIERFDPTIRVGANPPISSNEGRKDETDITFRRSDCNAAGDGLGQLPSHHRGGYDTILPNSKRPPAAKWSFQATLPLQRLMRVFRVTAIFRRWLTVFRQSRWS